MTSPILVVLLAATAQTPAPSAAARWGVLSDGWLLSVSAGAGFPYGDFNAEEGAVGIWYGLSTPLRAAVARRWGAVELNAYATYSPLAGPCIPGCWGEEWGVGLGAAYHPRRSLTDDAYVGLSAGFTAMRVAIPGVLNQTFPGPELTLQFGYDWIWGRHFRGGGFLGGTIGVFASNFAPALHGWFMAGLRITFGPWGGAGPD